MPITALPTPPSRADSANFASRADAFLAALPTFATEANALATEVNNNADSAAADAASAAVNAASSAVAAATADSAANVTKWISGTSYAEGVVVWSPLSFLSYRRRSAGAGTTDPSLDPANWGVLTLKANSVNAIASGSLPNGAAVVVNADGTVSVASGYDTSVASSNQNPPVFESAYTSYIAAVYHPVAQKIVIAYEDLGNGSFGTAIVGTVSGTSISFGLPVVFESAPTSWISIAYDANAQKVVIAYRDDANSNYGTIVAGDVSGTTISFGAPVVFRSGIVSYTAVAYDASTQRIVVAYRDDSDSGFGKANVLTVSGTLIINMSVVAFESDSTSWVSMTYDDNAQKVVIAYRDDVNSSFGTAIVGTVSGGSISFGTASVFESASTSDISIAYNAVAQKVVIAYRDGGNSSYGTAIVGTVSGTSISFGSANVFSTTYSDYISITYDSNAQKVVIAYRDGGVTLNGFAIVGTVSGTSISFGTQIVFQNGNPNVTSSAYDVSAQKVVIAYQNNNNGGFGTAISLTVSGTTFAPLPPNLTGSIKAVYDSNSQKVVIAYFDATNSNRGTVVVGTVSGMSISFGTPVVFENNASYEIAIAYDANAQKVVIAYQNNGNSNYGTAIVGTVSGTSISFGTPVVFQSANTSSNSVAYDANAQKVVIAYRNNGNSNRGTAIVGTVSGTSISFGSSVVFNTGNTNVITTAYDASSQKIVIAYSDSGNGGVGTARVGTVTGSSIAFGSSKIFENANTDSISIAYDANAQKVVIAYRDLVNDNFGTAIVGTVSGTSISFGPHVVFEPAAVENVSIAYDSNAKKIAIAYKDVGNLNYGTAIVGEVSNDSILFGAPIVFNNQVTSQISITYDAVNQKIVGSYAGRGTGIVIQPLKTNLTPENYIGISDANYTNGQTATIQIVGAVDDAQSGLTPGQKYFVQPSGALSLVENVGVPVFAGTAVSSTSLIVKG